MEGQQVVRDPLCTCGGAKDFALVLFRLGHQGDDVAGVVEGVAGQAERAADEDRCQLRAKLLLGVMRRSKAAGQVMTQAMLSA